MNTVLDSFYTSSNWRCGPRESIISCIETSIKTVMDLSPESVDGLRVIRRQLVFPTDANYAGPIL